MSSLGRFGLATAAVLLVCGLALPVSYAQSRSMVLQMNTNGAYLGVQTDDVTAGNVSKYKLSSEKGAIIRSVQKASPAEDAKLQEDDVILEYAGSPVWSAAQFSRLVQETPVGRKVDLGVSRDGKRLTLTAQIGSRDDRRSGNRPEVLPGDRSGDVLRMFPFDLPDGQQIRPQVRPAEPERKPRLGVTLQPVTDQLGEFLGVPGKKGALIATVQEGSAGAGKLKSGDVVTSADGKPVSAPEDLIRIVNDKSQGSLTLKVVRDKKEITVVVNLPAAPAEEGKGIKL
jgi:serine protease Do